MLYCLVCIDRENSIETRMQNREDHLKYVAETNVVKFAGISASSRAIFDSQPAFTLPTNSCLTRTPNKIANIIPNSITR